MDSSGITSTYAADGSIIIISSIIFYALIDCAAAAVEESISIADFFPPNRRVDFYCRFLPAKYLLDESISIADDCSSRSKKQAGCELRQDKEHEQ